MEYKDFNGEPVCINVLACFEQWKDKNGLSGMWKISVNNSTYNIVKNGADMKVLSFFVGEEIRDCLNDVREDREDCIIQALEEYYKWKGKIIVK